MPRLTAFHTLVGGVLVYHAYATNSICVPGGSGQLTCTITQASDCSLIRDYPYARNLFCPAAFAAAQSMQNMLRNTLGTPAEPTGFFEYYQTVADPSSEDPSQTTTACMQTVPPYQGGPTTVQGAGLPLCHLDAYVTSPGPLTPITSATLEGNPLPSVLRDFPSYFQALYPNDRSASLLNFRPGSIYDPLIRNLGENAVPSFKHDYPRFSVDSLYDPSHWSSDNRYEGINGGGGGGWGAEIGVKSPGKQKRTLLAFGGGGGGGMTSHRHPAGTHVGAGGGGGMQFADGYVFDGVNYNGLGLGAGVGSDETNVQYSYNDYAASGRSPSPVHDYNEPVIREYIQQMRHLRYKLRAKYLSGFSVVLTGGGGMGAGVEYLRLDGDEYVPHALSTQAGFRFKYVFRLPSACGGLIAGEENSAENTTDDSEDAGQPSFYEHLGDYYRVATDIAYKECGRDYSNFVCMCPKEHAIVICLVAQELGDPALIPDWLQQQHCGDDGSNVNATSMFTSYQDLLLASSQTIVESTAFSSGGRRALSVDASSCTNNLRSYFTATEQAEVLLDDDIACPMGA